MRSTIRSVVANVVGNASLSSSSRTENRAAGELSGLGIDPLPEYEVRFACLVMDILFSCL
jgi:hypothetical protein